MALSWTYVSQLDHVLGQLKSVCREAAVAGGDNPVERRISEVWPVRQSETVVVDPHLSESLPGATLCEARVPPDENVRTVADGIAASPSTDAGPADGSVSPVPCDAATSSRFPVQGPSAEPLPGDLAVRVGQDGAEEGPAKDQSQNADDRGTQNDAGNAASGERCPDKPDGEEGTGETASAGSLMERPETRVGRYKLLDVLGEGGTGIVYVAEQEEPIRRRVALKVIKPGMDSAGVIARFEAEHQALALLDHPNIAHVFDAGTTDSGCPYFVMEYVEGPPITKYCDEHKLTVEERLRLFQQVCDAMRHAHEKGIIHRDIKPSNILVSTEGNKAIPKIIDLSVVKAISQPLTACTMATGDSQPCGTPGGLSYEQADMAGEDVDTRCDTHSLGTLLYVLLAGVLPSDAKGDGDVPA